MFSIFFSLLFLCFVLFACLLDMFTYLFADGLASAGRKSLR